MWLCAVVDFIPKLETFTLIEFSNEKKNEISRYGWESGRKGKREGWGMGRTRNETTKMSYYWNSNAIDMLKSNIITSKDSMENKWEREKKELQKPAHLLKISFHYSSFFFSDGRLIIRQWKRIFMDYLSLLHLISFLPPPPSSPIHLSFEVIRSFAS